MARRDAANAALDRAAPPGDAFDPCGRRVTCAPAPERQKTRQADRHAGFSHCHSLLRVTSLLRTAPNACRETEMVGAERLELPTYAL
ncbi:LuxR family transcriptional regulator [Burkholderia pseudomallei]|uniref:LuxR family transcriptional regulator n=1 Tax=Burkholderia pseudomallei TaxID=28450 RepID=A0AAX0UAR3_BURPE|nr:hypothetical protein BPC006_I2404 [Burkholderia pseudomallei BPC006]AUL58167.1 LuxR family transcriptional regulator [Burkholderia pseudomallei]EEH26815.1 conserved hypothetical protein [Burkholderia pseudomallei Pakistan 9]AYX09152.1 LuxR family transcriptional regulator [Burkholderia pseudomallei]MPT63068.1 LuxR family transcriptional regulator [Burkholderia pseudomallei]